MGKKRLIFAGAALLCLGAALLSLCLGTAKLTLGQLWQALLSGPNGTVGVIFWLSRMPRTCACLLCGGALTVSGCVLQSVLGNSLASPGIIGVNAGAGLAVTLCCVFGAVSGWAYSVGAFVGAMASALFVMLLAMRTGVSRTTVILAGVAMNSILVALRDAVVTLFPEAGMTGSDFRVGGFSAVSSVRLVPAAVLILAAVVIVLVMRNELDVLALGEETARGLGLRVGRVRTAFLILSAMLAGAEVSFAGLLGFVGLLVPNMARRLVGNQARYLLPLSLLLGAGLVTACDVAARVLFVPYGLPVGILMAVIGGPVFLVLLLRRKGGRSHD